MNVATSASDRPSRSTLHAATTSTSGERRPSRGGRIPAVYRVPWRPICPHPGTSRHLPAAGCSDRRKLPFLVLDGLSRRADPQVQSDAHGISDLFTAYAKYLLSVCLSSRNETSGIRAFPGVVSEVLSVWLLPPSCNCVQRPPDGQAGMLGIPHGRQPLKPRYGLRWPFSAGRAERRALC